MYKKGDIVVYGTSGICEIGEISTIDISGAPKDREYYILYPRNNGGKIYAPVDLATSKMRKIITKEEAQELISSIPTIKPLVNTNEKTMENAYKECLGNFDCTEWVRLIKCIYDRKQKRIESGKKMTTVDEKYMRMAEDILYQELAEALDIPKNQVLGYIAEQIENSNK